MEEVADADYVIILDNGKIAAEGTPLDLKNRYTGDYINLYGISESDAKSLGVHYKAISGGYRLFVKSTGDISSLIASNPSLFSDCEVTKGKMDDVFLAVTGKKLKEYEELALGVDESYVPPDLKAEIFWLKNRMPLRWKEKDSAESGEDEGDVGIIEIPAADRIDCAEGEDEV